MVGRVVLSVLGRAKPQVPIQRLRYGVVVVDARELADPTVPKGGLHGVHLPHVPDGAGPDALGELADRMERMALVPQLGGHLVLPRGLRQHPNFIQSVRERLLAVDVLPELHSKARDAFPGRIHR